MALYRGVVKGNVIVLSDDAHLTDGTPVEVRVPAVDAEVKGREADPEEAFKLLLLRRGLISEIRRPANVPLEPDDFTPIRVEGKPLSEQIIEERR